MEPEPGEHSDEEEEDEVQEVKMSRAADMDGDEDEDEYNDAISKDLGWDDLSAAQVEAAESLGYDEGGWPVIPPPCNGACIASLGRVAPCWCTGHTFLKCTTETPL